uniref:G protein-activated inward rectifier potassium channel 2-like n=1 Tax=Saccoglossus kowalevskii TaxID=10224 RepID=A0ABM0MJY1_SACKO|nr:PREDICTED: G protein-activated inward rectifier potassium channel 2-like [Saccoglossus kowalevskii]
MVTLGRSVHSTNQTLRQQLLQYRLCLRYSHRLMSKDGKFNIKHKSTQAPSRYLADIFTTLIDIKWRWNLTIFSLVYVVSWLFFGVIWWLIAIGHGDHIKSNYKDPEFKPCTYNVYSWWTAFLFSLETQTTIGYGFRSVTDQCLPSIITLIVQSVLSCMIDAACVGCMFAKLARPKNRAETLMFTKNAVILMRNKKLRLVFRVADIRRSHILNPHVQAKLVQRQVTEEGEIIPLHYYDVKVGREQVQNQIFLEWPIEVQHIIDEKSPFWDVSADDLKRADFELILILEGIVEQTGMTTQKRTSYLADEILWGHRFDQSVVCFNNGGYEVDFSKFNKTYKTSKTPRLSGRELAQTLQDKFKVVTINENETERNRNTNCNNSRFTCFKVGSEDECESTDCEA